MAINLVVEAEIVELLTDKPSVNDRFLVDTNVWYWFTYTAAGAYIHSRSRDYLTYINSCLKDDSELFHSTLSLSEISHTIEKTEYDIYSNRGPAWKIKEFRHNLAERMRVVNEINTAWAQVENLSAAIPATVDQPCVDASLTRLQSQKIDGYDLFILESMKAHGIEQVITDDSDYATVPGIRVFTANLNVIKSARNQGKLLKR